MKCAAPSPRLLVVFFAVLVSSSAVAPVRRCEELTTVGLGSNVRIESAKLVPNAPQLPEHCEVRGIIWPENAFVVKLPTVWNSRFQMVGNAAFGGVLELGAVDRAVRAGYASATTNTGHDFEKERGATFAYPGAANPHAERKAIDFAYLAVHETVVVAKKIIHAYYGSAPRYSYFLGCSTGGRQGMMEAQRYPEDFDGYIIGAPVLFLSRVHLWRIWNAQAVIEGPGAILLEKLPTLAAAVYKQCDKLDGIVDGLIEDPRACSFDPARDLLPCASGQNEPICFTAPQLASLKRVYDGVRDSKGTRLYPGIPPGAELMLNGPKGAFSAWSYYIVGLPNTALNRSESFMQYMGLVPPPGPTWKYQQFDFGTDVVRLASMGAKTDAINPELSAVKTRGAKIVHYHGWADTQVTAFESVNYYESVRQLMGDKGTREFYRLFLVPGMLHCGGGPGCGNADWLSALIDWVENGRAPDQIVGSHRENGKITRTRPLCPYPEIARFHGRGDTDIAANFSCSPAPARP